MKNPFLLMLFFPLFLVGCNNVIEEKIEENYESSLYPKIILSSGEWMSIAYDDPKEVFEDDIKNIIDNFLRQEYVGSKFQTRTGISISALNNTKKYNLSEKTSLAATRSGKVSACEIDCPISEYEFELDGEEHRVVVSTDERYPKVLALMKVNESTETDLPSYCENIPKQDASQTMLNLSYEALYRHLDEIEAIRDSLRDKTLRR